MEFFNEKCFSSVELQQILLDMIQTLKLLLEHGFSENTIVLNPNYVYISVYDDRPKFVCIPISKQKQNKCDKNTNDNNISAFFRKIIFNINTNNAYSLIGLVLEETSRKKFSISRFETQLENFTDITVKDVDKGYKKAALIGFMLPVLTGILSALLMWAGFEFVAMRFYIEYDFIAFLSVTIASILTMIIGLVISQRPKNKKSVERKDIKYNYSTSELESIKKEKQEQENADERVRERKVEHLDMKTAVANAVVKSGILTFSDTPYSNHVVRAASAYQDSSPEINRENVSFVNRANQKDANRPVSDPKIGSVRSEMAYVPQINNFSSGNIERGRENYEDSESTNLLNFNNEPLPEKRYAQNITPYLVSLNVPNKKVILNREHFTVGKSDDCDLIIQIDTVSRHHAVINVSKIGCSIVDNSTNGTYINNVRIQKGVPTAIKNGDVVSFNREQFKFFDR